uniref:Protein TsetseEP domain-containing protein n=1 Tax=Anopheles atroparvus TaxID=41427 RepID=A0A182JDR6_ANOAO
MASDITNCLLQASVITFTPGVGVSVWVCVTTRWIEPAVYGHDSLPVYEHINRPSQAAQAEHRAGECSVSAEPRPDFALHRPLYGTVKVSDAVGELGSETGTLTANLALTLQSNYQGLSSVLGAMTVLGQTLDGLLDNVLGPLGYLANADSASAYDLFGETLAAIGTALSFLNDGYEDVLEGLHLVRHPLPSQFGEAFHRLAEGLEELRDALVELSNFVESALSSSSSEEFSCHHRAVPPRLVYRVAYAVRNLRAYLPLVAFLIETTVTNLRLVDEYLVRLQAETDLVLNVEQYVDLVDAHLLPIVSSVDSAVLVVQGQLSSVVAGISGLSNIQTVSSYPQLVSALLSFDTVLDQLSSASSSFFDALDDVGDELADLLLNPVTNIPTIGDSGVVKTLVVTLLSNGPFANYCFCKYSELLFGFADLGLNGVEECIDREGERMRDLKRYMLEQIEQLEYDFENLVEQLSVCDGIGQNNRRNNCVRRLAMRYNSLANNYDRKFDNIFDNGVTEAKASKDRLAACVIALQFRLIDEANDDLKREIKKCARHGPYCGQEGLEEGGSGMPLVA